MVEISPKNTKEKPDNLWQSWGAPVRSPELRKNNEAEGVKCRLQEDSRKSELLGTWNTSQRKRQAVYTSVRG